MLKELGLEVLRTGNETAVRLFKAVVQNYDKGQARIRVLARMDWIFHARFDRSIARRVSVHRFVCVS